MYSAKQKEAIPKINSQIWQAFNTHTLSQLTSKSIPFLNGDSIILLLRERRQLIIPFLEQTGVAVKAPVTVIT